MPSLSLIVFSGDYDRCLAAFTIANGAAGEGQHVTMFFTFWGISLLRRARAPGRGPLQGMFKRLMPAGPDQLGLSRFNFAGMGPILLRRLIRRQKGETLADLVRMALDRGVDLVACEASLKMLGISREELLATDRLHIGNVHDYLRAAREADVCLFI